MKNNISEEDKFKVSVNSDDLKDPNTTKDLVDLQKTNKSVEVVYDKDKKGISEEIDVIEPQDDTTITYLSNVVDVETGEVSKPFTIDSKSYQVVRGKLPSKEIVMGVFCHDDVDDNGVNVIHPIDYFDENIATPAKVRMEEDIKMSEEANKPKDNSINLSEFKHFFVNEKSGKFRKFKTVFELAGATMNEDEKYMPSKDFKKFFESKIFGTPKKTSVEPLLEVTPTGDESEEELGIKAKKLMAMIAKRIPSNVIETIRTPIAKKEVILAFAELIGVPRNGLSKLISGVKDIAKQGVEPTQPEQPAITENKKLTKNDLTKEILDSQVIKKIKVKDIK